MAIASAKLQPKEPAKVTEQTESSAVTGSKSASESVSEPVSVQTNSTLEVHTSRSDEVVNVEDVEVVILFDPQLMDGLNTVRLSVQVPYPVKTQDGESVAFQEVSLIPGLQLKTATEWRGIQSQTNKIMREAIDRGAVRQFMLSVDEFNSYQPYQAIDAVRRCIDESSVQLLQQWLTGSLASRSNAVKEAIESKLAELMRADSFAQVRAMMPTVN